MACTMYFTKTKIPSKFTLHLTIYDHSKTATFQPPCKCSSFDHDYFRPLRPMRIMSKVLIIQLAGSASSTPDAISRLVFLLCLERFVGNRQDGYLSTQILSPRKTGTVTSHVHTEDCRPR